ncbi:MAG: CRISPR-associated protein Cas4 [Deltaproteobacteria bacterium GWF2_42_12]|nr:MAG: CRISPR-associated protein Cas4 [Deltaproteobacteria bacterium GWF2_42_12]OGQ64491.1 MAG: CRISPR-associated protein Cas4 [Deltaproteobacteria bacterium RIFCSPLOWO2_12_FULL_42_16]
MIHLRVSDLKQFVYCQRVVFYNYVMPVEKKATFKMEYGKIAEDKIDRLENRRKLKEYGLSSGTREFHKQLYSERYALSGKVDLLIKTKDSYYPVDFKYTTSQPHKNHLYQLLGYAIILEDVYNRNVDKGFVYLIPKEDAVVFDLTGKVKEETKNLLDDIRKMIHCQQIPPPVNSPAKCLDCEYRNFCGDVL